MQTFIAHPFTSTNPEGQTLGVVLSWMADNLKSDAVLPVMKKHGLESFDPQCWYPAQSVQNIARDLCKEPDTMNIFVAIGKKFALEFPFAPNVEALPEAILAFNEIYHTLNQGISSDEGFLIEKTQTNALIVTNNTPWPGELIYGILVTLGSRFKVRPDFKVTLLSPDEHLRAVFEVSY